MENVHVLEFDSRRRTAAVTLFQHDTGQVLDFASAFPDGVELQFDSGDARIIKDGRAEIPNAFLASAGSRAAWIQVINEDSETTVYKVAIAIIPRAPKEYMSPEDEQTFRQQIQQILDETLAIAQSVRDDANAGKFNGAPGPAGNDGVSPAAKVEQTDTGAVISVTDADGTSTATVSNGKDGQPGADGEPGKDGVDRSSVYVGNSEPTDPTVTLWLDPEGEGGDSDKMSFLLTVTAKDLEGETVTASNDFGEEYTKEVTSAEEELMFYFNHAGTVKISNSKNLNVVYAKVGNYIADDLSGDMFVISHSDKCIVTASSEDDGAVPNLIDGDVFTWWGSTTGFPVWIQFALKKGKFYPQLLEMFPRNGWATRTPKDFSVQGSNNGETWDDLKTFSNTVTTLDYIPFDLSDVETQGYKYIRVYITSTNDTSNFPNVTNLAEMRLNGFYEG